MKKQLIVSLLAAGALVLASAAPASANGAGQNGPDSPPTGSIVDVAVAASGGGTPDNNPGDYDILVQAVIATGLAPVLADENSEFTVFAPTDRAFALLVKDLTGEAPTSEADALNTITTALSVEQITNVLLYHVVPDSALSSRSVLLSRTLTMANGGIVQPRGVNLVDENSAFANPRLVPSALNIPATNGIIHTVNRVLVPAVL
ncbi:fasciclin domain-containing protein [Cryobacterium sp. CG_9.6]|uniref:fasciclin domain-containing protein n=1 Tax=Cryobacterium sp. CG_9.6 TaxID=2760710 RepID=UPI002474C241|nr:fasciclin domain-containing protein [Cryobacterium sp. CG_9.6]MDH6237545.1 putative surface protein with fasciclin (FAS1) repeats [Cryobacterium sp. CG_9.6]